MYEESKSELEWKREGEWERNGTVISTNISYACTLNVCAQYCATALKESAWMKCNPISCEQTRREFERGKNRTPRDYCNFKLHMLVNCFMFAQYETTIKAVRKKERKNDCIIAIHIRAACKLSKCFTYMMCVSKQIWKRNKWNQINTKMM